MKKIILSLSMLAAAGAYAQNTGIGTTTPTEKLEVAGNIKSTTINSNAGAATDKVVVADTNGVLKSVDRSGFAEIVGNEVLNVTPSRGLVRSGSGTTDNPYTVGLSPSIDRLSTIRGSSSGAWSVQYFPYFNILDALSPNGPISSLDNIKCSDVNNNKLIGSQGEYHCSFPDSSGLRHWVYQGAILKNGAYMFGRVILPDNATLEYERYSMNPPSSGNSSFEVTDITSTNPTYFYNFTIGADTYRIPRLVRYVSTQDGSW